MCECRNPDPLDIIIKNNFFLKKNSEFIVLKIREGFSQIILLRDALAVPNHVLKTVIPASATDSCYPEHFRHLKNGARHWGFHVKLLQLGAHAALQRLLELFDLQFQQFARAGAA